MKIAISFIIGLVVGAVVFKESPPQNNIEVRCPDIKFPEDKGSEIIKELKEISNNNQETISGYIEELKKSNEELSDCQKDKVRMEEDIIYWKNKYITSD